MNNSSRISNTAMYQPSDEGAFVFFPRLPKELRVKIWEYALRPRVIPLHRSNARFNTFNRRSVFLSLTTTHQCLQAIPRACAESLSVFRKNYRDWPIWNFQKTAYSTAYDPRNDVVFFTVHSHQRYLEEFILQYPEETRLMQTVALASCFTDGERYTASILAYLRAFENLREIFIVLGERRKPQNVSGVDDDREPFIILEEAMKTLEGWKSERWPDWNIPVIRIVKSHHDILT